MIIESQTPDDLNQVICVFNHAMEDEDVKVLMSVSFDFANVVEEKENHDEVTTWVINS